MFYKNEHISVRRANQRLRIKQADKIKNVVIIVLLIMVAALLGAIVSLKRSANMQNYAIANDCTWTYQGTMYGDSRDYICK